MSRTGQAWFVKRPRRWEDLIGPHPAEQEHPYEVVALVRLGKMDYENFITDLLADRPFLQDTCAQCEIGVVWKCILVQRRGDTGGVLVLPSGGCYVGWAAAI
ncbi:MAG: hypothetical protein IJ751_00595 [Oscillospiraceae bacterium]|nr:hypothetical protein [Oscillospiraceae bacterium]